jgi:hypothetical protein
MRIAASLLDGSRASMKSPSATGFFGIARGAWKSRGAGGAVTIRSVSAIAEPYLRRPRLQAAIFGTLALIGYLHYADLVA